MFYEKIYWFASYFQLFHYVRFHLDWSRYWYPGGKKKGTKILSKNIFKVSRQKERVWEKQELKTSTHFIKGSEKNKRNSEVMKPMTIEKAEVRHIKHAKIKRYLIFFDFFLKKKTKENVDRIYAAITKCDQLIFLFVLCYCEDENNFIVWWPTQVLRRIYF